MIVTRARIRAAVHIGMAHARRRLQALLSFLVSGLFLGAVFTLAGCLLAMAGVYLLAGMGWALLAGALPLLITGFLFLRGVLDGE